MDSTDLGTRLEQRLRGTADGIREDLRELEETIHQREAELDELRKLRTRGRQMLRMADPDAPELQKPEGGHNGAGPRKGGRTKHGPISEQKVEAMKDWLEEHREELQDEPLWVSSIMGHEDFDLMSHATVNVALQVLADEGVLRLDQVGGGGRREYRLTRKVATE